MLTIDSIILSNYRLPLDPPEWDDQRRDYIFTQPLSAEADGWITLPGAAGMGVEIDWQGSEKYKIGTGTMQL